MKESKNNQVVKEKKNPLLSENVAAWRRRMCREIIGVNPFNFNHHLWDVEMIATWCNWRVDQTLRAEVLVEDECQAKSTQRAANTGHGSRWETSQP